MGQRMKYALLVCLLGLGDEPLPIERQLSLDVCQIHANAGIEPWRTRIHADARYKNMDLRGARMFCFAEPWHLKRLKLKEAPAACPVQTSSNP